VYLILGLMGGGIEEQTSRAIGTQRMAEVVYFASGQDGKTELSDGETLIGHIETVGLAFEIKPVAGSILDGMGAHPYPSKQEALEAIESHTGRTCEPAVT
jgi:hypothetical protein